MSQPTPLDSAVIEKLLALPTLEQRRAFLHAANLLHAAGLSQLLDMATHLIDSNPGQTRQLAIICAELADRAAAPAAVPWAAYIRAQTHFINAEFETALELIEAARAGYAALGETLKALRTNVGMMSVLNELGRHQEALARGQTVLNALNGAAQLPPETGPAEARLLTALVNQNFGIAYERMGRYAEALDAYARAEQHYRALDMADRLGDITNNRGLVLLNLGRGREALAAFQATAKLGAEAGLTLLQAQALNNVGHAQLLLGNYMRSLEAFEQARRLYTALDALAEQYILLIGMAEAYLALNLYPEALAAYREAGNLLEAEGMAHHRAWALWGMGSALIAQGQLEEAEQALARAAELFGAAENIPLLSNVMLEQVDLLAARGNREAALALARQALAMVSQNDWPVQQIYAHLRLADLLMPDLAAAEPHLLAAQQLAGELALPQLRYRLNQRLGQVRLHQGHHHQAQVLLEAAVTDIEKLRGTLAQEAVRASFLRDKTAAYQDLVQLHLARGDEASLQQAFSIAERARARALVDLLAGAADAKPSGQQESGLATRLQALQADLNVIYNQLFGNRDDSQPGARLPDLKKRAVELEQEISRLRLQAVTATSGVDPFGAPLPLEDIQARLPSDLILLSYYDCGDEILAFINFRGQIKVVRHLATRAEVQHLLQRLAIHWDRFRAGPAFVNQHMNQLERTAQRLLASLYAWLVAPLEGFLAGAANRSPQTPARLVIVPHGLLHQVPFPALFDGEQYLLDRFEISHAPSATILALCQERKPARSGQALVMGVADPFIPAVTSEAQAVARHLKRAAVHLGSQATLATLKAEAANCDILHLACHGLFRADNPMFSALKLHDGWLTAAEVMQLELAGALVTLSACESGRSQVIEGDEIMGLSRAFLGAGAASLVVSLWLVQDETTASLMATWYEQLRHGLGRAAALRAAQLALKAHHPHPYYWAPFVLVGQP